MVSKKKVPDQRNFTLPISKKCLVPGGLPRTMKIHPRPPLAKGGWGDLGIGIHDFLVVIVLVVLATFLYLNSFQVPFHFDDRPNIVDNRSVHLQTLTLDQFRRLITLSFS